MKKALVILFMGALSCFAQEKKSLKNNPNNEFPKNTAEHDSLKAIKIYNDSINGRISKIDQHLNAIQTKWDYVMSSPDDKQKAEEEGWFARMETIRDELEQEKQDLKTKLK